MTSSSELLLIDAPGFLWRCYHALPQRLRQDGMSTQAVEGFLGIVLRPILERNRSTHVAVIFEPGGKTFRHGLYPSYKGHRPPPPPDFGAQVALARLAVEAYGLPAISVPGFEADDVLATLATQAKAQHMKVVITTQDKDLCQVVCDKSSIRLYDQKTKKLMREAEVLEKFGVAPHLVPDVQALAGDGADGIPGVPGVGMKTAMELVSLIGPIEVILKSLHLVGRPKLRNALAEHADRAILSKELALLRCDVPLDHTLDQLQKPQTSCSDQAKAFLAEHELPAYLCPR